VDVLCLDKTGTLTEGTLQLTETVYYSLNRDEVSRALAAVAAADQEQNATVRAIGAAFPNAPDWRAVSKMPFSSQTKWQAVSFEGHGTFILGAPDVVLPYQADEALLFCREAAEKGARTLALLQSPAQTAPETLPEDRRVLAVLLMTDQVRPDAGNVLNYFKAQGVEVRVISGDHLATVARICESVGLTGACVDAR
jgi:cation-transporting ATPase E